MEAGNAISNCENCKSIVHVDTPGTGRVKGSDELRQGYIQVVTCLLMLRLNNFIIDI